MSYHKALAELKSNIKFLEIKNDYVLGDFKIPKGMSIPISEDSISKIDSGYLDLNILDIIQNMMMCTAICDDLPLNEEYDDLLSDLFLNTEQMILESLLDVRHITNPLKTAGILKSFSDRMAKPEYFIISARSFISLYQNIKDNICLAFAETALYQALSFGDNAEAFYLLSYIFDRKGKHVLAHDYAIKSLNSSPENEIKLNVESGMKYLVSLKNIEIAQSLIADGDFNGAIDILKSDDVEDDWTKNLLIGEAYISMEKSKEALPFLKKALDLNPTNPQIYSSIGLAAFMEGDIGNSQRFLENGLKLQPLNLEIMKNLSLLYSRTGKSETALKLMKKASEIYPNDIEILDIISYIKDKMNS